MLQCPFRGAHGRYDSYTTLVGADEVLFINAHYESKVLRDMTWLASRKEIMRKVMDRVIVIEPADHSVNILLEHTCEG